MGDGNARNKVNLLRGLKIAVACVVVFIGAFAIGSAVAGPFFWYPCSLNGLDAHGPSQASVLLASDGTRLGLLGATGNRHPVSLQGVSPVMRKAMVDTEDRRFYVNNGIDYIGIMRALKSDVSSGGITQGASTIEQQLVRNLYLTPQQTLGRVLVWKEQPIAEGVEREAQQPEAVGGGGVEGRQAMLLGKPMLGGKLKAATPHLLVVAELRPATIPPTLLEVIREYPAHPQSIVPEMCAHEEAASRVGIVDVVVEIRQGGVDLIVTLAHPCRTIADAEVNDHRREIISE